MLDYHDTRIEPQIGEVSKLIGTPNISDHTIAVVKSFHLPILDDQYPNVCCFISTSLRIDGN